jgi:UDP-glucose 4-epimerase
MENSYSTSKTCAERLLRQYRDAYGLRAAVVRPTNAYGPRQRAAGPFAAGKVRKIMPALVLRALCGMPLEVYGGGSQVSDCVWVGDVARTFVSALEHCARGEAPTAPVEVGPAESNTVLEVAQMVNLAATKYTGQVGSISHLPMRPGEKAAPDVPHDVLDDVLVEIAQRLDYSGAPEYLPAFRRVLATLGTRVRADPATLAQVGLDVADFVPITEGIRRTVEWFAENEAVTWCRPPQDLAGRLLAGERIPVSDLA